MPLSSENNYCTCSERLHMLVWPVPCAHNAMEKKPETTRPTPHVSQSILFSLLEFSMFYSHFSLECRTREIFFVFFCVISLTAKNNWGANYVRSDFLLFEWIRTNKAYFHGLWLLMFSLLPPFKGWHEAKNVVWKLRRRHICHRIRLYLHCVCNTQLDSIRLSHHRR